MFKCVHFKNVFVCLAFYLVFCYAAQCMKYTLLIFLCLLIFATRTYIYLFVYFIFFICLVFYYLFSYIINNFYCISSFYTSFTLPKHLFSNLSIYLWTFNDILLFSDIINAFLIVCMFKFFATQALHYQSLSGLFIY